MKPNKEHCNKILESIECKIEESYIEKAKVQFNKDIGNLFCNRYSDEQLLNLKMERLVEDRNFILKELEEINLKENREQCLQSLYSEYVCIDTMDSFKKVCGEE